MIDVVLEVITWVGVALFAGGILAYMFTSDKED